MDIPQVDFLSSLPDEILIKVLSSIPIEDAVRTGTLSTRWKNLWKYLPILSVDQETISPVHQLLHRTYIRDHFRLAKIVAITGRTTKFLNVVNEIQRQYAGNLETFSVRTFLDKKYEPHLKKWTSFIRSHGASNVGINLCYVPDSPSYLQPYVFRDFVDIDAGMLEHVRRLALSFLRLVQPNPSVVFSSLVDLFLEFVDVSEKDFQNLVFSCAMLRSLEIVRCENFCHLRLSSSSLEKITIRECMSLTEIDLFCKKLTSFELYGFETKLGHLDTPKIRSLTYSLTPSIISPDMVYKYLAACSATWSEFEILRLSFNRRSRRGWPCPDSPPSCANMNLSEASNYKMIGKYAPVVYLLASASSLREFHLNIPSKCYLVAAEWENMAANVSPPTNLRRVRLNAFNGSDSQLELASWILENAVDLEILEIKVSFSEESVTRVKDFTLLNAIDEELKSTTYEYLHGKVPPGCSLVII